MMERAAASRGGTVPDRSFFEQRYAPGGMVFAGDPQEIADRIIALQRALGHSRQILQMDIGQLPHAEAMRSVELLGTEVLPRVHTALA